MIDVIRREKPRLVFTPYPDDRHPDHARAGRLVTDAAFYAGTPQDRDEAPRAPAAADDLLLDGLSCQEPDFIVDVTAA